jgi:hypothetical protein
MVPLFCKVYSSRRNVGKDYFANEAFILKTAVTR